MSYPNDPRGRQPESWETNPTQYIPPQGGQGGQNYPPQGRPPQGYQQGYQQAGPPQINPFGAESNETFGIAGTVLALLGGVVGVVALTALDWFSKGGATRSFSDTSNAADQYNFTGFASAYFGWLAWAFLIVTVAAAVGSSFPSPAVRALRIVGVVVGLAAAGLSFLALRLQNGVDYTEYLKQARAGFYLLVIGYVLAAIGAGIGPSRVAPIRR